MTQTETLNSTEKTRDRIILGICLLLSFALSWLVHDKLSWGADDGFYAYMAERMAAGDVIHKDLQVLHPGLLYFFHETIFKIFGEGFVSLRYPLIIITLLQTALAFKIARPYGLLTAIASATALTAFSFVQFVNATPNWYLVFFAVFIGYILDKTNVRSARALLLIGFLVGVSFSLRQLTGVFFAMAVTSALFLKFPTIDNEKVRKAGVVILGLLGLSLTVYLFSSAKPIGFLLFGIWPSIFLFCAAVRSRIDWPSAFYIIGWLFAGAFVSALPLIIYHLVTGSFFELINETFIAPFTYHGLGFISESSYALFPFISLREIFGGQLSATFGLIYWTILLLLNIVLAIVVIRKTLREEGELSAIAVLAVFHSLVALILEIPLYLNYIVGPVLLALLIVTNSTDHRKKLAALTVSLSLVAIIFGAGQPMERGREYTILLKKIDGANTKISGTSLYSSQQTAFIYNNLVDIIKACSKQKDTIYVYPSNPEIYAFAQRKSAFSFTGSYFGVANMLDLRNNAMLLASEYGPAMIIHNTADVYNTDLAVKLFQQESGKYQRVGKIERFEIFARIETLDSFPDCLSTFATFRTIESLE